MGTNQPMNVMERHIERMKQWLTGGQPQELKSRRVKPRQGDLFIPLKNVGEAAGLIQQLHEEVPEFPWVVEIDGQSNDFVKALCRKIREVQPTSRFGIVSPHPDDVPIAMGATLRLLTTIAKSVTRTTPRAVVSPLRASIRYAPAASLGWTRIVSSPGA